MGAVDVSREGGFLHKSVFGGAAMLKEPIHSGTTSLGMFNGVKEELVGGMASVAIVAVRYFLEIGASCCCLYCSLKLSRPGRIYVAN
jgi:hypothetical protein